MSWSSCKYCGKQIVWAKMPQGHWLPMDPIYDGPHECARSSGSDSSTAHSNGSGWSVFDDRSNLTFVTTCWWCGKQVYFHRNTNGGSVLFDELGPPWLVHICWKQHQHDYRASAAHFEDSLRSLGYDGRFYRSSHKLLSSPDNAKSIVDVYGYVVDNRALYETPQTEVFCAIENSFSPEISQLIVSYGRTNMLPFSLPANDARLIQNFSLIRTSGLWIWRHERWILRLQNLQVLDEQGIVKYELSFPVLALPVQCCVCGNAIRKHELWAFNLEFQIVCESCSWSLGANDLPSKN